MTKDAPELSLVIPARDEAESVADCVTEARNVLADLGRPFEIIVIDDGSADRTFDVLRDLKKTVPELRAARLARPAGQTAAMEAGFRRARGDIVITMDADMQNDPADIPAMLDKLADCDAVCGVRAKRRDSLVRRVSSRIANGFRNALTGESIRDTGCTLKVYRRDFLEKLKLYEGMHRFLPTLLRLAGARVIETPVNHRPRLRGRTKYGIGNRLPRGLRDLFAVRWMKKRWIRSEVAEEIE